MVVDILSAVCLNIIMHYKHWVIYNYKLVDWASLHILCKLQLHIFQLYNGNLNTVNIVLIVMAILGYKYYLNISVKYDFNRIIKYIKYNMLDYI